MEMTDPDSPPKPCEYFDMIGGTSTGGYENASFLKSSDTFADIFSLIAIMLGRLQMTVDECITAYTSLSDRVFRKQRHRLKLNGQMQGRFDSLELERAIKQIVAQQGFREDLELMDSPDAPCKMYVLIPKLLQRLNMLVDALHVTHFHDGHIHLET